MNSVFKHLKYKQVRELEFNPDIIAIVLAKMTVKEMFVFMQKLNQDGKGLQRRAEEEEKRGENAMDNNYGTSSFSSIPTGYSIYSDSKMFGSLLSPPNSSPIPLEEYFMRKVESLINKGSMLKILSNMGRSLFNDERLLSLLQKRNEIKDFMDLEYRGILFPGDCRPTGNAARHSAKYNRGDIPLKNDSDSEGSDSSEESMGESSESEKGFPKRTITRHDIQNACVLLEYVNKISSLDGKRNHNVSSLYLMKDDKRNFMLDPKLCSKLSTQGAYFVSLIVNSVIDYCKNRCRVWQDLVIIQVPNEDYLNQTNMDDVQEYFFYDLKHNLLFDDVGTFFKYNVYAFDIVPKRSLNNFYFNPSLESSLVTDDCRDVINQAIEKGFTVVGVDIIMNFLKEKLYEPSTMESKMLREKLQKNFFEKPYGMFRAFQNSNTTDGHQVETTPINLSDLPTFVFGDEDILSCNVKRAQKIERLMLKTAEFAARLTISEKSPFFDEYDYFYTAITSYLFDEGSKLMYPRRDERLPPPHCLRTCTLLRRLLNCLQIDKTQEDQGSKTTEYEKIRLILKKALIECTMKDPDSKRNPDVEAELKSKFEEINFDDAIQEAKGKSDFTVVSSQCIFFSDNLWMCK